VTAATTQAVNVVCTNFMEYLEKVEIEKISNG